LPTEVEGRKMQKPYLRLLRLDLLNYFQGLPSSFSLNHLHFKIFKIMWLQAEATSADT
jgi:hypothetical protein